MKNTETPDKVPLFSKVSKVSHIDVVYFSAPDPNNWSQEIEEIESFFKNRELPKDPLRLDKCSTIVDIQSFVKSHLYTIKANSGKRAFKPYLQRLQFLMTCLRETIETLRL